MRTCIAEALKDNDSPHGEPWAKFWMQTEVGDGVVISKSHQVCKPLHCQGTVLPRHCLMPIGPTDTPLEPAAERPFGQHKVLVSFSEGATCRCHMQRHQRLCN